MSSAFVVQRGTDAKIKAQAVSDGHVSFATDTRKIYLDNKDQRIMFGGSTGILYADKKFPEDTESFSFALEDLENATDYPSKDDLILNSDGSFYRVIKVNSAGNTISVIQLTVAGGGGGGIASRIVTKAVSTSPLYYTTASDNWPLSFIAYSSEEDVILSVEIKVGDKNVAQISDIAQSKEEANTINLAPYKKFFPINEMVRVQLTFTDDIGSDAKTLTWNVTQLDLQVTFADRLPAAQLQNFLTQVSLKGQNSLQEPKITFSLIDPTSGNVGLSWVMNLEGAAGGEISQYQTITVEHRNGTWKLQAVLSGKINDEELTSEPDSINIIFKEAGQSGYSFVSDQSITKASQFDTLVLNYMVTGPDENIEVELVTACNNEEISRVKVTVQDGIYSQWNIPFDRSGVYQLTIYKTEDYFKALEPITVSKNANKIPTINTSNGALALYLAAKGRSNLETNANVWACDYNSTIDNNGNKGIAAIMENFNWQSNGWQTVNGVTSLHLNNSAKVTIPFSPFKATGGAANAGCTIELDFKISNVRDRSKNVITCLSKEKDEDADADATCGFAANASRVGFNSNLIKALKTTSESNVGMTARYRDGDRIHLAYCISSSMSSEPKSVFYTYLDGVISGIVKYSDQDKFQDAGPSRLAQFVFDSTYADIDIYNIRVYNQILEDRIILNNYLADLQNTRTSALAWAKNDILNDVGKVSYNAISNPSINPDMPYMLFTGGQMWDKNNKVIGDDGDCRLPIGKKDFRYMEMLYIDPARPERNMDTIQKIMTYGQGTSSMQYPVKNLRIKWIAKKEGYVLEEGIPKVNCFTLKADYMESSSSHNTGTGNMLSDLYKSVQYKTPAEKKYPEKRLLTAIIGHPIVCFWRKTENDPYDYIGRYNFNLDKGTPEPYGFVPNKDDKYGYILDEAGEFVPGFAATTDEWADGDYEAFSTKTYYTEPDLEKQWTGTTISEFNTYIKTNPLYEHVDEVPCIQCWEFLDNSKDLAKFVTKNWNPDDGHVMWTEAFESRYPEYPTEQASDKRGFARLVKWIGSTDQNAATDEPLTEPDGGYTADSKEYRLYKFKKEFSDYMDLNFTAFYYILTKALIMIDSRAKNMMMCSFDVDVNKGTGHWFPIFYDMDTMLGVNNQGFLSYDYDVEDDDAGVFNASANYNHPNYSVLWCNFKEAFKDEIRDRYWALRNSQFTYNNLIRLFNTEQANKWCETLINEDEKYKYIDPLLNNQESAADYLYAGQGTRSHHREYLLYNRLNYLDGEYENEGTATAHQNLVASMRIYTPSSVVDATDTNDDKLMAESVKVVPASPKFTLTSGAKEYVSIKYSQTLTKPTLLQPFVPTTIDPKGSYNNTETYLYGLHEVYDLGDLSPLYLGTLQFTTPLKLTKLTLGNDNEQYHNSYFKGLTLTAMDKVTKKPYSLLPLLEELNVRHLHGEFTGLDLSANTYLKTLLAKGCDNLKTIILPTGGNIRKLELPKALESLTVKGHQFYNTDEEGALTFPNGHEALKTLVIENCPLVNTKKLFSDYKDTLTRIRFTDIKWAFDSSELTVDGNTITSIPLLDELVAMNGIDANGTMVDKAEVNNSYITGSIVINNSDAQGVNEITMYEKYTKAFPELTIKYNENSYCVKGYTVNVTSADAKVLPKYTVKISEDNNGVENFTNNLTTWIEGVTEGISRTPIPKYQYIFKGWSTKKVQTFYEDGDTSSMNAAIDIKVENGKATLADDFALTFGEDQTVTFYPVYYAEIRTYLVTFFDENGTTVLKSEQVKYNHAATPPPAPMKIELPEEDKTIAYAYEFVGFEPNTYKQVVSELKTKATYGARKDIHEIAADARYFRVIGTTATLLNTYPYEAITVPLQINGNTITRFSIAQGDCPNLKRIFFRPGNSIISLEAYLRNQCSKFEYCDFANLTNLTSIGQQAFQNCSAMVCTKLPNKLQSIGSYGFAYCSNITISTLPASLVSLDMYAFMGCTGITSLNLDEIKVQNIPSGCFQDCTNLTVPKLHLGNIEQIGAGGFQGCKKLRLTFPEGKSKITTIDNWGFFDCPNLGLDDLPSTLQTVGRFGFSSLGATLNFTTIPASVRKLGYAAFGDIHFASPVIYVETDNLELETTVPNVGQVRPAFDGATGLSTIIVPATVDMNTQPWNNTNGWGSGAIIEQAKE